MGILDKIENKLGGGSKEEEASKVQRQAGQTGQDIRSTSGNYSSNSPSAGSYNSSGQYNSASGQFKNTPGSFPDASGEGSSLQHPIGSGTRGPSGSAIGPDGNVNHHAIPGHDERVERERSAREKVERDRLAKEQHTAGLASSQGVSDPSYARDGTLYSSSHEPPHVSNTGYGREDPSIASTRHQLQDSHIGTASTTDRNVPNQPYDPYSSRGQQIAANSADTRGGYGASNNRAEAGDIGSRTSADNNVPRTQGGGVSNQLNTGPHSQLENRDAVPTAGGQKLGEGSTTGQHHYGRDAAVSGGAGALGTGAYEEHKHHGKHHHGHHGDPTTSTTTTTNTSTNQPTTTTSQHHYGRDAALAGGAGAVGVGGYEASKNHGQTGYSQTSSSVPQSGVSSSGYQQPRTETQATHGSNISYMNRPSADQPLSQSSDFAQRHPTATSGTTDSYNSPSPVTHHYGRDAAVAGGAGALGAGAVYEGGKHHNQQDHRDQGIVGTTSDYPSQTSATGATGSSATRTAGVPGATSTGATSTGASQPQMSARTANAKGMGAAYEAGYEAGYRDAMEHKQAQY